MSKRLRNNIILSTSLTMAFVLSVGTTLAGWSTTDNANPMGIGITIEADIKEEGHYLYWGSDTEGVKLNRTPTGESGYYSYELTIDNSMLGSSSTFTIKDELDNLVLQETSGVNIGLAGTYKITNKSTGYDFTYRLYYNNNGTSFSPCNAHFFGGVGDASTAWPGLGMTQIGSTNEYYYDVDAKKYASGSAKVVFNKNSGNEKTVDITLSGITAGVTGYQRTNTAQLYLKYTNNTYWVGDGASTAAYLFGAGKPNLWYAMTTSATDQVGVTINDDLTGYTNVIFVRLKPSTAEGYSGDNGGLNWTNKWNQTDDLDFGVGRINDYALNGEEHSEGKKGANYTANPYLVSTYSHVV